MKIIEDYRIINKFQTGWKRKISDINEVIIHHTEGGQDYEGLMSWELSEERRQWYNKNIGVPMYVIKGNGQIYQWHEMERAFWCSDNPNDGKCIPIELMHKSDEFPDRQYDALFHLLFFEIDRQINLQVISGHDYYFKKAYGKLKNCPGSNFDWTRLEQEMIARNIFWQSIEEMNYVIS